MRFLADALDGPDGVDVYGKIVALFVEWSEAHQANAPAAGVGEPAKPEPDMGELVADTAPDSAPIPHASALVERGEPPPVDVLTDFVAEAQDLLNQAETTVVGRDHFNFDEINAVFRAFHTVKGMAAYMGLPVIEQAAHGYETGFQPVREGTVPANEGFAAAVLIGVDALRRLVNDVKADVARRRSGSDSSRTPTSAAVVPVPASIVPPAPRAVSPGVPAPVLVPVVQTQPAALAQAPPSAVPLGERLGDLLVEQGVPRRAVERAAVALESGQRLGDKLVAEGVATRQQVEQAVQVQQSIKTAGDGFSRVATAKLEELMNQVGELLIAQAMVQHDPELVPNSHLAQAVTRQGRILRQLQVLSLSLRMVPLRGTFQKMARVVYDTAKKLGKQVEFGVSGEETEIDRTLAETMGDPLMHMVRNGVDHGIETQDERARAGKPAIGKLHLEAFHAGDDVVIRLSDDGKGMDAQKLRAKAIEKGLIDPHRPMDEQECFQLIFLPGFSTAAKVTDVSGRGVGMDVVRRQVEAANGSIQITSQPGQGSVFIIRLPMTTAILDAMQLRVGREHLLMPIGSVVEMLRPRPDQVKSLLGEGRVIEHRGRSLPMVCLADELAISGHQPDPSQGILVIIENRGSDYALQVDEILGQRQVVIKPFDQSVPHHPGASGTTILGDGRVGLILNPAHLVRSRSGVLDIPA
jgi:two-component system chemotaxis sensor kinase CheA